MSGCAWERLDFAVRTVPRPDNRIGVFGVPTNHGCGHRDRHHRSGPDA